MSGLSMHNVRLRCLRFWSILTHLGPNLGPTSVYFGIKMYRQQQQQRQQQVVRWNLIEAHWSHIDSVFGVDVVRPQRGEVEDWKSDVLLVVEFQHGRSPRSACVAAVVGQHLGGVLAFGFALLEDGFLESLEFHGTFVSSGLLVEPDWSLLAVDGPH